MKVEITTEERNTLLQRTEMKGKILFDGSTPSNNELTQRISKGDSNLIVIKQIAARFGSQQASFRAFRYDSIEARKKAERMTKYLKKQAEEAAKKIAEEKKTAAEATKKGEPA